MQRLPLAVLAFAVPVACLAGDYADLHLSDDSRSLTFSFRGVQQIAPVSEPEQEQFQLPKVSSDGRLLGWLAATSNCCTSYPLPTILVVARGGRVVRTFREAPPIWAWSFAQAGTAVAYAQRFPHGASPVLYKLRRIQDGKLLASFTCSPESRPAQAAPSWSKGIWYECPA